MIELVRDNWLVVAGALLVAAILLWLLLRPRQRVRLTDSTPTRPHMPEIGSPPEPRRGVASEAAAAAGDVAGQILGTRVHQAAAPAPGGEGDDFQKLKGVGPKFAQMLVARGFTRFDQLASLTGEEVDRLDGELGPFRGRLRRDRIVEQAAFLARGDIDGFEQHFGKL